MKTLEDLEKALEKGLTSWEEQIVNKHAGVMANKVVREVKDLTPVLSGNLRRRWFYKIEHDNGQVILRICNDADYAAAVNNGHRVVVHGKTVGKKDGKRMLEKGISTYENKYMKKDVEDMLENLKRAMK